MIGNYVGVALGVAMLIVVAAKVFIDRQMKIAEAIPIAAMFGIWTYMQLHGRPGNSALLLVVGYILLARVYRRNAPVFAQRFNRKLAEIQARKLHRPS